jgi:hypothetical protein
MKLAPALAEDRTVQPALLRNVHSRLGDGPAERVRFLIRRSSITIRPWLLASSIESLCTKSLRIRVSRAQPADRVQRAPMAPQTTPLIVGSSAAGGLLTPSLA